MAETVTAETASYNVDIQSLNGSYDPGVFDIANRSTPLLPVVEALSSLSANGTANDQPSLQESSSQWRSEAETEEPADVSYSVDHSNSKQTKIPDGSETAAAGDNGNNRKSNSLKNGSASQPRNADEAATVHNGIHDANHYLSINGCGEHGVVYDPESGGGTEVTGSLGGLVSDGQLLEADEEESCKNDSQKQHKNGSDLDSLSAVELQQLAAILYPMLDAITSSSSLVVTSRDLQQQLPPASEQGKCDVAVKHQSDDDYAGDKINDETNSSFDENYNTHDYREVDDEVSENVTRIDIEKSLSAEDTHHSSTDQVSSETPKEPLSSADEMSSAPSALNLQPNGCMQQQRLESGDSLTNKYPLSVNSPSAQMDNCISSPQLTTAVSVSESDNVTGATVTCNELTGAEGRTADTSDTTPGSVPRFDSNHIDTTLECQMSDNDSNSVSEDAGQQEGNAVISDGNKTNCQDEGLHHLPTGDGHQHNAAVTVTTPDTNVEPTEVGSRQQMLSATTNAGTDARSESDDAVGGAVKDRKDSGSKMEAGMSRFQRIALLMKLQKEMAMMQLEMTKLRSAMRSADELLQQLMDSEFQDEKD